MFEPEIISSLLEHTGKMVASIQRDSADMYAAASAARDLGQTQRALFGQARAARLHSDAAEWLGWLADDAFMREWCDNINRGRYKEERNRVAEVKLPYSEPWIRFYIDGLRLREVF